MDDRMVLSENEVLDLLAFLVTAARTLIDEPVDYGPMRLLTAAQRVCETAASKCSRDLSQLMQTLMDEIPVSLARRNQDRPAFLAFLDRSCHAVASAILRRYGREGNST